MSVPGIFKLSRMSIMLQIWDLDLMPFFVTGKGWSSGDSCLDEHLFNIGRVSTCAESCASETMKYHKIQRSKFRLPYTATDATSGMIM